MAALTVIEALPGFGKTTLVATWAREQQARGSRVVWIRATADLDNVPAFLDLLRQGLVRAAVVRQAVPGTRDPDSEEAAWVDDLAHAERPVIVVVDDAHRLHDPDVAAALVRLVEVAHALHVVACADADHQFHEAAPDHGRESNVLLGGDLSIKAGEVSRFAEAWGHDLSADQAIKLHQLVGGWLLPLRLVLDATPAWSDQFATHVADRFLMDQVLPDLTDTAVLSMSMRFAVPKHLTVELATALLEADGPGGCPEATAERAIACLERRGLLWRVPRHDGVGQWRYPTLLGRALRAELNRSQPEAARAAHREVVKVLASSPDGSGRGALLRHARLANDWELLAELWTQEGWWLCGAEPEAFVFAYVGIPRGPQQEASLRLATSLADALATTSPDSDWTTRAETILGHYLQMGADFLQDRVGARSPHQLVDMMTAGMAAHRRNGRLHEAGELAIEAARQIARIRAADAPPQHSEQAAWFNLQWGLTHMMSGDRSTAYQKTTTAYEIDPGSIVGAAAAAALSALHAISGETDDARRWLAAHEVVDLSGHWAAGLAEAAAHLARANLALDRLDDETAESELARTGLRSEFSSLWPLSLIVHTRHALLFGDPMAMLSRLDHLALVVDRQLKPNDGLGRQAVERCRVELLLALGEVNQAQPRLAEGHVVPPWLTTPAARFHLMTDSARQAVQIATTNVWRRDIPVRDRLELLVISTLGFRELGATDRVMESFRHAHGLSQRTGILDPFLLFPAEVRHELLQASGLELPDDVQTSLDAVPRVYPEHAELVQLSPRELAVLRQIRDHETAAGVARTLTVSVNTVKKQLVSLYAKLGVHDRSSALLRAQRLGLIGELGDIEPDSGVDRVDPEPGAGPRQPALGPRP